MSTEIEICKILILNFSADITYIFQCQKAVTLSFYNVSCQRLANKSFVFKQFLIVIHLLIIPFLYLKTLQHCKVVKEYRRIDDQNKVSIDETYFILNFRFRITFTAYN